MISPYWNQLITGGGIIALNKSHMVVGIPEAFEEQYTDAQLDDYTMHGRSKYPWKPPLKMTIQARFETPDIDAFHGTAGFGFWNNPFSPDGHIYTLPEAVWFFYASSDSAMLPQGKQSKGHGWQAQVIHSMKWSNLVNAIPTSLAVLSTNLTNNPFAAYYWMNRFAGAQSEMIRSDPLIWHTYIIEWRKNSVAFYVDTEKIMESFYSPTRPLGFVLWVDNQYAVVKPTGLVKFGKLDSGPLFLHVSHIKIEQL